LPHANILLLGIDGARQGYWVTAASDVDSSSLVFELTRDLSPLFARAARNETLIVIDVPIGILSGSAAAAGRVCDREARRAVGPRRSSVFTPPSRDAFGAATRWRRRDATGKPAGSQSVVNRGAFSVVVKFDGHALHSKV
jgi:predicted RNase H-like nuclease